MTRSRDLANLGDNTSKLEQQGLVKIIPSSVAVGSGTGSADSTGKVTFDGASTVSLNNVFSSTYTHYKIILDVTSVSSVTSPFIGLRLRSNGSDYSTGNHNYARFVANQAGGSAASGSTTFTYFLLGTVDDTAAGFNYEITMFGPNTSRNYKNIISHGVSDNHGPGALYLDLVSGKVNITTSYDGFTILLSAAGNITGTVTVYGFN